LIDALNGRPRRLRKPRAARPFFAKERVGFADFELSPAHDLRSEIAGLALELLVVLMDLAAAFRAARRKGAEVAGNRVALVALRLADDMLGDLDDLAHESIALQLAVLHLRELEFPFGGELGREELGHAQTMEQGQERERLGGRHELAAVAIHVLLRDQPLDDLRACRRCAQALLAHRLAEVFVVDQLARALHRGEQRRLGEARGRARRVRAASTFTVAMRSPGFTGVSVASPASAAPV
jgi:hypothetical protein